MITPRSSVSGEPAAPADLVVHLVWLALHAQVEQVENPNELEPDPPALSVAVVVLGHSAATLGRPQRGLAVRGGEQDEPLLAQTPLVRGPGGDYPELEQQHGGVPAVFARGRFAAHLGSPLLPNDPAQQPGPPSDNDPRKAYMRPRSAAAPGSASYDGPCGRS